MNIQDKLQDLFPKHFRSGNILILNADCMEVMKHIKDDEFELSCVDPPYGIGAGAKGFTNGNRKKERKYHRTNDWDKIRPSKAYFDELKRVSKNQIIWGGNYFSDMLDPFRCFIFWDKTIHGNSYADGELAWTSFDKVARYWRCNMVETTKDGRIHPTQKPVKLYKWLLSNYAEKGQSILDTHLGSGSSAIAAHYFGCDFTGIEIDKDYYDAACERFKAETAQEALF